MKLKLIVAVLFAIFLAPINPSQAADVEVVLDLTAEINIISPVVAEHENYTVGQSSYQTSVGTFRVHTSYGFYSTTLGEKHSGGLAHQTIVTPSYLIIRGFPIYYHLFKAFVEQEGVVYMVTTNSIYKYDQSLDAFEVVATTACYIYANPETSSLTLGPDGGRDVNVGQVNYMDGKWSFDLYGGLTCSKFQLPTE